MNNEKSVLDMSQEELTEWIMAPLLDVWNDIVDKGIEDQFIEELNRKEANRKTVEIASSIIEEEKRNPTPDIDNIF